MGSIKAWLPSRKSTLHHTGGLVILRSGHWRSFSEMVGNGWYFFDGSFSMATLLSSFGGRAPRAMPAMTHKFVVKNEKGHLTVTPLVASQKIVLEQASDGGQR